MRLGINSHIKAVQDNPVGGKGSCEQAKESEITPLSLLEVQQKPKQTSKQTKKSECMQRT